MLTMKGSYHTIVFAPDSLNPDEGPLVQVETKGLPGLGIQTTLPVPDSEAILLDRNGNGIYFNNPRPARRTIGFRR